MSPKNTLHRFPITAARAAQLRHPRRARLALEALEDRALMAAAVTIDAADALAFVANTTGSTVTVSYAAGTYTITDPSEVINVTNNGTGAVTGSGTNIITVTNTASLDFDLHGGNSSLILNSNNNPTTLHDSTGGGDLFQIGSGTSQLINGAVTIGSTVTGSSATVDDSADVTGRAVNVTSTTVTGMTPAPIDLTGATLTSLSLFAGTGADTFTVNGTPTATAIQGDNAGDTVNAQATSAGATLAITGTQAETVNIGNAGSVQGLLSAVSVTNTNAGTTVTVNDSADATARTATISSTGISAGLAPTAINFSGPGALTVSGGTGGNTFTVTGTPGTTTLNSGTGADTVNVRGTSAGKALTVHGLNGVDTVTIGNASSAQGIAGAVSIDNTAGFTALTVDDSADATARTVTLSGTQITGVAPAAISYTNSDLSQLTVSLGSGGNTVTVTGTPTATTLNSGTGADTVTVQATTTGNALTIHGQNGADTVTIGSAGSAQGIAGAVSIDNTTGTTALTVDDSAAVTTRIATLSGTQLTGVAPAAISYADLSQLTASLGSGGNNVTVTGTPAATILNTGTGADIVSVQGTSAGAALTVHGQDGIDAFTVGNAGSAQGIAGAVSVDNTAGLTALSVDDSADATARTATISATGISAGLAPAAINFSGPGSLTVSGGTGGNTFTVTGTPTLTTLNSGTGADTVNVQSTSAGLALTVDGQNGADTVTIGNAGSAQGIAGAVSIGNTTGTTALTVNDSADATARTVTLSGTQITGVAPAAIGYANLSQLTASLGSGGNTVTVTGTPAATTLNSGTGTDTVTVAATSAGKALTVHGQNGADTVTVGSAGSAQGIAGAVTLDNTTGATALAVDDSADVTTRTVTLTGTQITGVAPAAIGYANLSQLTASLGSGGNTVTVTNTPATPTTLNTGTGVDTVTIAATTGILTVLGGGGADHVTVGNAGNAQGLLGPVTLSNTTGSFDLTVDDSADATVRNATVSATQITGFASTGVIYSNASALHLLGGSGGDTFTFTNAGTNTFPTSVVGGTGNDVFKFLGVSTLGTGGTLNGGGGVNSLDYTGYTAPVTVDLIGGTATGTSGISNIQNILPSDLTVALSHTGAFRQGDAADGYTVTVSNAGPGAAIGAVTVIVTLPTGLSPTAADTGTINGWTVSVSGQTIVATRSDVLAAGASYPALALTVSVSATAPTSVTVTATVSGGGQINTANDSASDPTTIEAVSPLAPVISGGNGQIVIPATGSTPARTVTAFAGFQGEVRVATADLNGDGVPDVIVGAGAGAPGGHIKVFDGATGAELKSFFAFDGFDGGVFVGTGDVNGDGTADIIVGAGAGAPGGHVKVFDGVSGAEIRSFFAFDGFTGGVQVAGGDTNGDGAADIIVGAGAGAPGGHVVVFDGRSGTVLQSFFAFDGFNGGVFVGAADLDGDGTDEILVGAGAGAGPNVKAFSSSGQTLVSFFAYDAAFTGGVRVAGAAGTGHDNIATGNGAGARGNERIFDPNGMLISSVASTDTSTMGIYVG